jgi:S1-C subfamily serine protease
MLIIVAFLAATTDGNFSGGITNASVEQTAALLAQLQGEKAPAEVDRATQGVVITVSADEAQPKAELIEKIFTELAAHNVVLQVAVDGTKRFKLDARLVAAYQDGEPAGLKIFGIAPASAYARRGLQNGDVITSIDGAALAADDAVVLGARVHGHALFKITVLRRGQPLTLDPAM